MFPFGCVDIFIQRRERTFSGSDRDVAFFKNSNFSSAANHANRKEHR